MSRSIEVYFTEPRWESFGGITVTVPELCPEFSVTPEFAVLQSDPRWVPFLESLGKSPAQLSAVRFNVETPR